MKGKEVDRIVLYKCYIGLYIYTPKAHSNGVQKKKKVNVGNRNKLPHSVC